MKMQKNENIELLNILKTIHPGISSYISFLLVMKSYFTKNVFFYLLSYFFRFTGIIIRCANFSITTQQIKLNKTISKAIRNFSSYKLIKLLKMNDNDYIKGCYIIYFFFIIRHFLYFTTLYKIITKKKNNISVSKLQIILDHFVFFFYPFILEYLSFKFYIIYLPNKFDIKNTSSSSMNITICIINSLLIIIYNINGFVHIISINSPYEEEKNPVKYRYSKQKFWTVFLLQNFCTIESLALFLVGKLLKYFKFVMISFFFVLFIFLYFSSLHMYNYPNLLNKLLSVLSGFSFFSLVIEVICCIFNYNITNQTRLLYMTCGKIMVSFLFYFVSNTIEKSSMIDHCSKELFKVNKTITSNSLCDAFLFIIDNLKLVVSEKNEEKISEILSIIHKHKKTCNKMKCKCKIINIFPYGKEYKKNFISNFIDRITFLIESSFMQIDYTKNYDVTMLLSENFFFFHQNPIMAYSMVHSLFHLHYNQLTLPQKMHIYEVSSKYIDYSKELRIKKNLKINNISDNMKIIENNKDIEFSENYKQLKKVQKVYKIFRNYCDNFIQIIQEKSKFNSSFKVEISHENEINQITSINAPYLTNENLKNFFDFLKMEIQYKNLFIKRTLTLSSGYLPIEFYYRSFIFCKYFLGGLIEEKLFPVLYSFSTDHHLYSSIIKTNTLILLLNRLNDTYILNSSSYNIIFECTKEIRPIYFSSTLMDILKYKSEKIYKTDIKNLLPNYIANGHNLALFRTNFLTQNKINLNQRKFIFCSNEYLYQCIFHSTTLLGLSKNLTFFTSLTLEEGENEYIFLLNPAFNIFSLSENFFTDYGISLYHASKFKLNILDLFGIKIDLIKDKIKNFNQTLNIYKKIFKMIPKEYFIRLLFNCNHQLNDSIKNYQPTFLVNDYVNLNKFTETKDENAIDEENRQLISELSGIRSQIEMIFNNRINLNNFFFKHSINTGKIYFLNKLNSFYSELKSSVDKNQLIDLQNIIVKNRRYINNAFLTESEKIDFNHNHYFCINLEIHLLYDTPFYVIKVKEMCFFTTPESDSLLNLTLSDSKKRTEISQGYFHKSLKSSKKIEIKENLTLVEKAKKKKVIELKSMSEAYSKKSRYILFFLLFLMLSIYIIIFFFQLRTIALNKSFFLSLYYNSLQREYFLNIYCILISSYYYYSYFLNDTENFKYKGLINYQIFQEKYYHSSDSLKESSLRFYSNYIDTNRNIGNYYKGIYDNITIEKFFVTWKSTKIISNYLKEIEYLYFESRISKLPSYNINNRNINDKDFIFLIDECKMLLYQNYLFYNESIIRIKNEYIKDLFYIIKNYDSFMNSFSFFESHIQKLYKDYSNKSKIRYFLCELFGFFVIFSFFLILGRYLKKYNYSMFTKIFKLFIVKENIDLIKLHEDSQKENLFIFKIVNDLNSLLIDLSKKNIENFNKGKELSTTSLNIQNDSNDIICKKTLFRKVIIEPIDEDENEISEINEIDKINNSKKKVSSFFNHRVKRRIVSNNNINNIKSILEMKHKKEMNQSNKSLNFSKLSISTDGFIDENSKKNLLNHVLTTQQKNENENCENNIEGNRRKESGNYDIDYIMKDNQFQNLSNIHDNSCFNESNEIERIDNRKSEDNTNNEFYINIDELFNQIKNTVILEIKIFYIVFLIILGGIFSFLITKSIKSIHIYSSVSDQFHDFQIIIQEKTNLFNFYDNLLSLLIVPNITNSSRLDSLVDFRRKSVLTQSKFIKSKLSQYKNTKKSIDKIFFNHDEKHINDLYIFICKYNSTEGAIIQSQKMNDICFNLISSNFTYFYENIDLGLETITQQILTIYSDYKVLGKDKYFDNDIPKYINKYDLYNSIININFVVYKIQEIVYYSFFIDFTVISKGIQLSIVCLNSIYLIIIFVLLVSVAFVDFRIQKLYNVVNESTERIRNTLIRIQQMNIN